MGRCVVCARDARVRAREMSAAAEATLVMMGQLEITAAGRPMCDECFAELRDALIDAETAALLPAVERASCPAAPEAGEGDEAILDKVS